MNIKQAALVTARALCPTYWNDTIAALAAGGIELPAKELTPAELREFINDEIKGDLELSIILDALDTNTVNWWTAQYNLED